MLGFNKYKIEEDQANEELKVSVDQEVISENEKNDSGISYNHNDWFRDFDAAHNTFKFEDEDVQNDNVKDDKLDNQFFVNNQIFDDNKEQVNDDTTVVEKVEDRIEIKEEKPVKKTRNGLSARAKIHITIYALLVFFVFSMLIANALINTYWSNAVSADSSRIHVEDKDLSTIELPDGSTVKIHKDKAVVSKANTNQFDKICDTLEGNN